MIATSKKVLVVLLAVVMVFFGFSSNVDAASPAKSAGYQSKVIAKKVNGNQVVEVKEGDKTGYVVVSAPVVSPSVADKSVSKEVESQSQSGQRWYLHFTEDLAEAQQVASIRPTDRIETMGIVSPDATKYFWHNSYIENWWNILHGSGYHLYLAPSDVSYITNLGWIAADTLAAVLIAAGIVSLPVGIALGCIATLAIVTTSWALQNNDGSIDIYSPDKDRYDNRSVSPGQYLGTAKSGIGVWKNYTWPSNAPKISR